MFVGKEMPENVRSELLPTPTASCLLTSNMESATGAKCTNILKFIFACPGTHIPNLELCTPMPCIQLTCTWRARRVKVVVHKQLSRLSHLGGLKTSFHSWRSFPRVPLSCLLQF